MASPDTRRALAGRRRSDRDRKRRQRASELASGVPDQRAVHAALAAALRGIIAGHGGVRGLPRGGDIDRVVDDARRHLRDGGYDVESVRAHVLLRRTLGV